MRPSPRICAARCGGSSAKAQSDDEVRTFLVGALRRVRAVSAAHVANDVGACGPGRSCSCLLGGFVFWRILARPAQSAARRGAGRRDRTFWIVAALLCAVAVGDLARARVAPCDARGGRWSLVGLVAARCDRAARARACTRTSATGIPRSPQRASRESGLVEQLAQRLESDPNDVEGWRLLAASYMQLGRYVEGRAAYQRVWALTPQPDDELKLAYAESQILTDRASADGRSGAARRGSARGGPRQAEGALVRRSRRARARPRGRRARRVGRGCSQLNPPERVARSRARRSSRRSARAPARRRRSRRRSGPEIKLERHAGCGAFRRPAWARTRQLFILARAPERRAAARRDPAAARARCPASSR